MKFTTTLFILSFSPFVFSQSEVNLQQEYLKDKSSFGAWEINQKSNSLDKGLSFSLQDKVLRKSEPFVVGNLATLKKSLVSESYRAKPELIIRLNTFSSYKSTDLKIDNILEVDDRYILRGEVENASGSKVKLVVHENEISGRITYPNSHNVTVIYSLDGVSAVYDIDVSDITYD